MFDDGGVLVQFLLALAVVLLLIVALTWILKKINAVSTRVGLQGGQPRLSVTEALSVDHKRRLVLVKRDHVEHLLLIGGENDLLLEYGILPHPAQQVRLQQAAAAQAAQSAPTTPTKTPPKPVPQPPAMTSARPMPTQADQKPADATAAHTKQAKKVAPQPQDKPQNNITSAVGSTANVGLAAPSESAAMFKTKQEQPQKANPEEIASRKSTIDPPTSQPIPVTPSNWRPERPSEKHEQTNIPTPNAEPLVQAQGSPEQILPSPPKPTAPVSTALDQGAGRSDPELLSVQEDGKGEQPNGTPDATPPETTEEQHKLPPLHPMTPQSNEATAHKTDKASEEKSTEPTQSEKHQAGVAYDDEINRLLNELSSGPNKS